MVAINTLRILASGIASKLPNYYYLLIIGDSMYDASYVMPRRKHCLRSNLISTLFLKLILNERRNENEDIK